LATEFSGTFSFVWQAAQAMMAGIERPRKNGARLGLTSIYYAALRRHPQKD
jgi:hypothetical protein